MGVWGCPLTQGLDQGGREKICGDMGVSLDPGTNLGRYTGIGAAHGPEEQFSGSTGVSRDPSNN